MGQLYMQRFEYRGSFDKATFDATWSVANASMARTGNFGNADEGVKHLRAYGTAWGGYALIEVEDPKAFEAYQLYHANNYSTIATITFEPLSDLDAALAPVLEELRSKS